MFYHTYDLFFIYLFVFSIPVSILYRCFFFFCAVFLSLYHVLSQCSLVQTYTNPGASTRYFAITIFGSPQNLGEARKRKNSICMTKAGFWHLIAISQKHRHMSPHRKLNRKRERSWVQWPASSGTDYVLFVDICSHSKTLQACETRVCLGTER